MQMEGLAHQGLLAATQGQVIKLDDDDYDYDDVEDINDNAGNAFVSCMKIDKRTDVLGVLINFFALCIHFRCKI